MHQEEMGSRSFFKHSTAIVLPLQQFLGNVLSTSSKEFLSGSGLETSEDTALWPKPNQLGMVKYIARLMLEEHGCLLKGLCNIFLSDIYYIYVE